MKYKVILFDADGITITSERFSTRMERDHGTPWEAMKPFFDGPFALCKIGKADLKTELEKVIPQWKWEGSVEELMDYWFKIGLTVNTEIVDLVENLREKGVKCYLATNQTTYRADYLANDFGLGKIFNGLYISAKIGHMKDEPIFFEKVLADLNKASRIPLNEGVLSEQVLFVDNDEKNLISAQQAGLATYDYKDFNSFKIFLEN